MRLTDMSEDEFNKLCRGVAGIVIDHFRDYVTEAVTRDARTVAEAVSKATVRDEVKSALMNDFRVEFKVIPKQEPQGPKPEYKICAKCLRTIPTTSVAYPGPVDARPYYFGPVRYPPEVKWYCADCWKDYS